MTARADMATSLSLSPSTPTKTFVVEVHADDPVGYLADVLRPHLVEATDDAFLFRAQLPHGEFWVDQLDERFWSFHTDMPMRPAFDFLRGRAEARRDMDWVWLPSEHLRRVWPGATSQRVRTDFQGHRLLGDAETARDLKVQLSGQDAEALLDYIAGHKHYRSAVSFDSVQALLDDPDLGRVNEGVNRMGRFAVSGDSLEFHLQFVRTVVQRYRRLVTLCEKRAISWHAFADDAAEGAGGALQGEPIVIEFSRAIADLPRFVDELFAARQPFRLWGVPEIMGDVAELEAVDLHVGQRLRMDVGRTWMRVYLTEGSCGNTVVRLISNLQHRFDSALQLLDPELQLALRAQLTSVDGLSN